MSNDEVCAIKAQWYCHRSSTVLDAVVVTSPTVRVQVKLSIVPLNNSPDAPRTIPSRAATKVTVRVPEPFASAADEYSTLVLSTMPLESLKANPAVLV